jgi:3',5'-cyclic-AMP phosphodiesterase
MGEILTENLNQDGIDRRGFLKCMAWAGTGTVCIMQGGVLKSYAFRDPHALPAAARQGDFAFAQISDSHIGFDKAANPDVTATLRQAIAKINALPDRVFFVPGEHDVLNDNGEQYRARYGKGTRGDGWQSFDHKGVHFLGLVNVMNLKAGGLGSLGAAQLAWLKQDLKSLKHSTPVVVFAHIPLWSVYPQWGWATDDSEQALGLLKKFGSVSVLNGHIHQVMQKVEGNVTFHTALSTAFPQPAPGQAPSPGPLNVGAEKLRSVLGVSEINFVRGRHALAIVDATLEEGSTQQLASSAGRMRRPVVRVLLGLALFIVALRPTAVRSSCSAKPAAEPPAGVRLAIDNFSFTPKEVTVPKGTTVTWVNDDDVPHTVVSSTGVFRSKALDTDDTFSFTFTDPGSFSYFCSVHPVMVGKVLVK